MLVKVKSSYFAKIIFSFINEGIKLKLVKYNKSFQKNLDLTIINYKFFSRKYIIYESDGYGKEYYHDGTLKFEGGYLHGERKGKGKEYFTYPPGEVKFEGEYLNGKRNGKGKEYYTNGELKFEGEYKDNKEFIGNKYDINGEITKYDKRNGKIEIKEYTEHGILKFEGEYLNGEKNGKGKEYSGSYLEFEGEYLNGKKNGKGKEFNSNGNIAFEGIYKNDKKWEGIGYDNLKNIIYELKDGKGFVKGYYYSGALAYESEYSNGEKNGKYKDYQEDGKLQSEGEYLNGKKTGKWKYYDEGKLSSEFEYLDGKKSGKGKIYDEEGNIINEGEYLYDFELRGKFYIDKKLEYEGEFLYNRKYNGKGYDKNGNIVYELINGNGKVKEYNNGGILQFDGEYINGQRYGKGKEYYYYGELHFEGEYINGKLKGFGKEYNEKGEVIYEGLYE